MKDVVKSGMRSGAEDKSKGRGSQNRGSMAGYCAVAFVFVALVVLVLCLTVFFKLKKVEINGLTLYREDQVIGIGGIIDDENLVRTDTDIIEKRLKDNLVFIEDVKVKKKYPSTLVINVTEAKKAADIQVGDTFSVVSGSGIILEMGNVDSTGTVPVIKGFELSSKAVGDKLESSDKNKLRIYNDVMKTLKKLDITKVGEIDMTSRSDIVLFYDGRINIEIGSTVDLEYKMGYFKSVIEEKLSDEFRGRVVYNGINSGISAIPEGAGASDDEPMPSDDSTPDEVPADEPKTDETPENVNDYGYMRNNPGGAGTNTGTDANANAGTDANAGNNYDANAGYNYDANAGNNYDANAGYNYDANAGYNYDANAGYGYDANAGYGYDANTDYGYGYNYQP